MEYKKVMHSNWPTDYVYLALLLQSNNNKHSITVKEVEALQELILSHELLQNPKIVYSTFLCTYAVRAHMLNIEYTDKTSPYSIIKSFTLKSEFTKDDLLRIVVERFDKQQLLVALSPEILDKLHTGSLLAKNKRLILNKNPRGRNFLSTNM